MKPLILPTFTYSHSIAPLAPLVPITPAVSSNESKPINQNQKQNDNIDIENILKFAQINSDTLEIGLDKKHGMRKIILTLSE